MKKTFSELVVRENQTCSACPDIRDLTMYDGSRWYVRLRHGMARLSCDYGPDDDFVTMNYGEGDCGVFASHEDFERVFMELAEMHPRVRLLLHGTEKDDTTELVKAAAELLERFLPKMTDDSIHNGELQIARELDEILVRFGEEERCW